MMEMLVGGTFTLLVVFAVGSLIVASVDGE
jgi:hypothetical protein